MIGGLYFILKRDLTQSPAWPTIHSIAQVGPGLLCLSTLTAVLVRNHQGPGSIALVPS